MNFFQRQVAEADVCETRELTRPLAWADKIGHGSLSSAWERLAATFQFRNVPKRRVAILRLWACGVPLQR